MNIQKVNDLMRNGNGQLQVPVCFQKAIFGLDQAFVRKLARKKARGLDIGCGVGALVNDLRENRVNFEGIDSLAPNKEYFMRQNVYGMKPFDGAIPRKDNFYDLVVAFQNTMLNRAFTLGGILRNPARYGGSKREIEDHQNRMLCGQYIFYEGTRVLKSGAGARFLIYPEAKRIEEIIGAGILRAQGIEVHSEDVERAVAREYMEWELDHYGLKEEARDGFLEERYFDDWGLYKRTVVTKTR